MVCTCSCDDVMMRLRTGVAFRTSFAAFRDRLRHLYMSQSEHYATVRLELEDRGDETELRVEFRGVPAGEEDSTREGWTRFYFQAIKQTFGY